MVLEGWGTGGTEPYVKQLAEWLRKQSQNIVVGACVLGKVASGEPDKELAWGDQWWVLADQAGGAANRFGGVLREFRPNVCHLHLYTSLLRIVLIARAHRVPMVVTTLHIPLTNWSARHRLAWRLAALLSDRIVAGSYATRESLGRLARRKRASVAVPPLPSQFSEDWLRAQAREPRRRDVFTVAGAGRLAAQKDWPVLIRGFAQFMRGTNPPAKLQLFGIGPLLEELQEVVRREGVGGHVHFAGYMPQNDLWRVLSDSDVFVLPSRFEGFGMAAVEAMALGVATVTSDFAASGEYILEGQTGYRFHRGNSAELAALLSKLYKNPRERQAVAERGRAWVLAHLTQDAAFAAYRSVLPGLSG
jgi:glycosyltransferase involved in cell wall biosynthesis